MAVVKCMNSHYYDDTKFRECPHCAAAAGAKMPRQQSVLEEQQVGNYAAEYIKKNMANAPADTEEEEKTISIYEKKRQTRCIAGWLVCTAGEDYGKDFPLYAGFNRIGSGKENDVVLKDAGVFGEDHCSVVYEEKKNIFYIFPKEGNPSYVDGEQVGQAQEIKSGQTITAGVTQLEFVAFCKGEKKWPLK